MQIATKQARELFREWGKENHISPETERKYLRMLERQIKLYGEFDTERVDELVQILRDCDFSDSYVRQNRSFFRRFTNFIEQTVFTAEPAEEPVQTELNTQTEAQPLPDHIKAELDRRAQLTREFLEIGARFRSLPPAAIKRAADTLRNALDAALDNFHRSHMREMVEWTAQDWEAAARNASGLFAELRKDKAVIAAFEALLQIVEVKE